MCIALVMRAKWLKESLFLVTSQIATWFASNKRESITWVRYSNLFVTPILPIRSIEDLRILKILFWRKYLVRTWYDDYHGVATSLKWRTHMNGYQGVVRYSPRRDQCCGPNPWILGLPIYLRAWFVVLGHSLHPPSSKFKPLVHTWVFLVFVWCSWCF